MNASSKIPTSSSLQDCHFYGDKDRVDGLPLIYFTGDASGLCYVNLRGYVIAPQREVIFLPPHSSWVRRFAWPIFRFCWKVLP